MAEPTELFAATHTSTAVSRLLDVGGRPFNTFAVATSGFSGSLEIQGNYPSDATNGEYNWRRVRYWIIDPETLAAPAGPFNGPLALPVTGVRHIYVFDPWRQLRVSKIHSGGIVTVYYFPQPLDPSFVLAGAARPASAAEVTQGDPDALHTAAHLRVGLEDVGALNPVPVGGTVGIEGSLPPGEYHIGQVGGYGERIRVDIVRPANTTAYTANDVVGTGQLVIPNAVRKPGGACYLHAITVLGNQANGGGAETWQPRVWIHQRPRATLLADNAAFTGSFTILQQTGFLREALLPALAAPAGSTIDKSVLENVSLVLVADQDSVHLYFDLQTLTAFTPASGALYAVIFDITKL